jgi:hypothetical protein
MIPSRLGASDYMPDDILIPTATEFVPHEGLDSFDSVAWRLASVLCRRCWHPWWRHGHGPFRALVDCPAGHLFDAL